MHTTCLTDGGVTAPITTIKHERETIWLKNKHVKILTNLWEASLESRSHGSLAISQAPLWKWYANSSSNATAQILH